jgi:hypothetical protein
MVRAPMWGRRLRYTLTLLGLCAIATCPAAKRSCTAKNRAREADDLLGVLAERVATVVATTGKVPAVPAGPTPQPSCCEQGGTCKADATLWSAQGWRDLHFSVDGTFRYAYQYIPDASGQSAILRATGDLDCDGEQAIYELKLTVKGTSVVRAWHRKNPYE